PGTLNALAGLLSTIINVYTAQQKQWSITARVSAIVEGACLGICGALFALYSGWMLERVKKRHNQEFGQMYGYYEDEGIVDKVKRKAQEPIPEPGRIV
ncbi:9134_t:CDS:1, partial [Acaulospora colombiana]